MKEIEGEPRPRGVALVAVVAASVVAFASLGGVGLAQSAVGLAQYQYGKKVTICHKGKNTIKISTRAWPAHKRHGDTLGTCAEAKKKAQAKKAATPRRHARQEGQVRWRARQEGGARAATPVAAPTSDTTAGKGKGNGQSGKSADKGQNGKGKDTAGSTTTDPSRS